MIRLLLLLFLSLFDYKVKAEDKKNINYTLKTSSYIFFSLINRSTLMAMINISTTQFRLSNIIIIFQFLKRKD